MYPAGLTCTACERCIPVLERRALPLPLARVLCPVPCMLAPVRDCTLEQLELQRQRVMSLPSSLPDGKHASQFCLQA